MVEKELGAATWRRKGLLPRTVRRRAAGLRRETTPGNSPFLLHAVVQSELNIDVEVEEPEASENSTQSFEIHNIIGRHQQLLTVIIYIILHCEQGLHNILNFYRDDDIGFPR